jgi:hypothetical protein
MREDLNYKSGNDEVVTLLANKKRVFINALCATSTIRHAALELGRSEKCLFDFLEEYNIDKEDLKLMRKKFALGKKKVKLKYKEIKNGQKTYYSKNIKK